MLIVVSLSVVAVLAFYASKPKEEDSNPAIEVVQNQPTTSPLVDGKSESLINEASRPVAQTEQQVTINYNDSIVIPASDETVERWIPWVEEKYADTFELDNFVDATFVEFDVEVLSQVVGEYVDTSAETYPILVTQVQIPIDLQVSSSTTIPIMISAISSGLPGQYALGGFVMQGQGNTRVSLTVNQDANQIVSGHVTQGRTRHLFHQTPEPGIVFVTEVRTGTVAMDELTNR